MSCLFVKWKDKHSNEAPGFSVDFRHFQMFSIDSPLNSDTFTFLNLKDWTIHSKVTVNLVRVPKNLWIWIEKCGKC